MWFITYVLLFLCLYRVLVFLYRRRNKSMSQVLHDVFASFEALRNTLIQGKVSETIKSQLDNILMPFLVDEAQRNNATEMINEIGDLTDNFIVPMLEQYSSADYALKVRFMVEDVCNSLDAYKERLAKKIDKDEKDRLATIGTDSALARVNKLSVNTKNRYRSALFREEPMFVKMNNRNKPKFVKFQLKKREAPASVPKKANTASQVNVSVLNLNNMKTIATKEPSKRSSKISFEPEFVDNRAMAGIGYTASKKGTLAMELGLHVPVLRKSGQVLVRVTAVGLNHYDYKKLENPGTAGYYAPRVETFNKLKQSVLAITETISPTEFKSSHRGSTSINGNGSVGQNGSSKSKVPEMPEVDLDVIGVEFCGVIEDLAWAKGDFLHKLHVSKEDVVYGVLRVATSMTKAQWIKRAEEGFSSGALSSYIVCDANDVSIIPKNLSPIKAASLPIDGSVVVRTLAFVELMKNKSQVLIIGGATNPGLILMELLIKDLGVPLTNISVVVMAEQVGAMKSIALVGENIMTYNTEEVGLVAGKYHAIFDCFSELELKIPKESLEKALSSTGSYYNLHSLRLMVEKSIKNESYLKELNLIKELVEQDKLSLSLLASASKEEVAELGSSRIVKFDDGSVQQALEELKTGHNVGKFVVEMDRADAELPRQN